MSQVIMEVTPSDLYAPGLDFYAEWQITTNVMDLNNTHFLSHSRSGVQVQLSRESSA